MNTCIATSLAWLVFLFNFIKSEYIIPVDVTEGWKPGGGGGCPPTLHVSFRMGSHRVVLLLVRNPSVNPHQTTVIVSANKTHYQTWHHKLSKNGLPCFYQDVDSLAAVSATKKTSTSPFMIDGSFAYNEQFFAIHHNTRSSQRLKRTASAHLLMTGHTIYPLSTVKGAIDRKSSRTMYHRSKRNVDEYKIELLVVVDYSLFELWSKISSASGGQAKRDEAIGNIRYYFSHVINDVDMRFKAIDSSDISISVTLVGIYISTSAGDSLTAVTRPDATGYVNVTRALDEFNHWVVQDLALPTFDHATLFTAHDLYAVIENSISTQTIGYTYSERICEYERVSVVEDRARFNSGVSLAHELAHNVGAIHDGTTSPKHPYVVNNCEATQYIMASSLHTTRQGTNSLRAKFSPCSITEMKQALEILESNQKKENKPMCLKDEPDIFNATEWNEYIKTLPGQKFILNQQCVHKFGFGAASCNHFAETPGEICSRIWCYDPARADQGSCWSTSDEAAAEGTTCGNKMWCRGGKCVTDDNAPEADPNCIAGDYLGPLQPAIGTCSKGVAQLPGFCYDSTNRRICCKSCADKKTDIPDCDYGDLATWCSTLRNDECYLNDHTCCQTCYNIARYLSLSASEVDCRYGDRVQGCDIRGCRTADYNQTCCLTCGLAEHVPLPSTTADSTTTSSDGRSSPGDHASFLRINQTLLAFVLFIVIAFIRLS